MQRVSQAQLQRLAKLRQKKYRLEYQRFLLSGPNTVQSALQSEFTKARALYVTEAGKSWLKELPIAPALPVFLLTEKQAVKISDETHPQGIVLEAELPPVAEAQFDDGIKSIYLHQINDPGNLGTIIRTALRFGFRQMLLSPQSADPFQPKVVRASTGYVTHLRLCEGVTAEQLRRWRQTANVHIAGTAVEGGIPLQDFRLPAKQPLLLVFGSEAHGIDEDIAQLCHELITIPGEALVESLNLAVSAGIILHHCYTEERKGRDVR